MSLNTFPNVNLTKFFNNVSAPGAGPFYTALKFYQDELRRNDAGGGLAQLAAAKASDAAQEQVPYAPAGAGQQAALAGRGGVISQLANARNTGRQTQSQVRNTDLQGALDTGKQFGQSIQDQLSGQIALNNASGGGIGDIFGIFSQLFSPNGLGSQLLQSLLSGTSGGSALPGAASAGFGSSAGPFSLLSGGGVGSFGSAVGPFSLGLEALLP